MYISRYIQSGFKGGQSLAVFLILHSTRDAEVKKLFFRKHTLCFPAGCPQQEGCDAHSPDAASSSIWWIFKQPVLKFVEENTGSPRSCHRTDANDYSCFCLFVLRLYVSLSLSLSYNFTHLCLTLYPVNVNLCLSLCYNCTCLCLSLYPMTVRVFVSLFIL